MFGLRYIGLVFDREGEDGRNASKEKVGEWRYYSYEKKLVKRSGIPVLTFKSKDHGDIEIDHILF